ncbi:MAG: carbohydrate ABC transporter permease, partial [Geminicoccaceae bacterium]|nr:carbohydrate ABC transporter permease [Geminicoccaceae bacterium]
MISARRSIPAELAAHGVLLLYTAIALFPILLVVWNSFKAKKAIFRSPLSLPTAETVSLIGYETVIRRGDFLLYFQNSLTITLVSLAFVLLFGAMAGFA